MTELKTCGYRSKKMDRCATSVNQALNYLQMRPFYCPATNLERLWSPVRQKHNRWFSVFLPLLA